MAFDTAKFGTCNRARHGCVIARDGLVLSTGYNGSVNGEKHCDEVGHQLINVNSLKQRPEEQKEDWGDFYYEHPGRSDIHCIRTIHAERNSILNAAMNGIAIWSADWYITGVPCWECAKMIARTNPTGLWICGDRGGANTSDEQDLLSWLAIQTNLVPHVKTSQELVSAGIIVGKGN